MRLRLAIVLVGVAVAAGSAHAQDRKFDPASVYNKETLQGFTVLMHPEVLRHPRDAEDLRRELGGQLAEVARVVPAEPLAALQKVRIWVEWNRKENGAAEFHVSAAWLKENGYNPEKAGCVEVSNTRNFLKWSRAAQPWMTLHELAHAYHHLGLGERHPGIEAAYQQAVDRKLYDSVEYVSGGKRTAYALTNPKEYFAELSEAYFGKNDFFPFTRADLRTHDPVGYRLMEQTWGQPRAAGDKGK
jgi:hypothetical protein